MQRNCESTTISNSRKKMFVNWKTWNEIFINYRQTDQFQSKVKFKQKTESHWMKVKAWINGH